MDPSLAEKTNRIIDANEYRAMHPQKDVDEEAPFHLLQTNSNVNLGVRFVEKESQFAMDPSLAEKYNNILDANEYKAMHPQK